jgi:hypothetical protein
MCHSILPMGAVYEPIYQSHGHVAMHHGMYKLFQVYHMGNILWPMVLHDDQLKLALGCSAIVHGILKCHLLYPTGDYPQLMVLLGA